MNSKESIVQSRIGRARVVNTISDLTPIPPVLPAFVSTWKTDNTSTGSSTNTQVRLPLTGTGTYNMTVDWGDGNSDVITVWNQAERTHTYGAIGTYVITIVGTCTGFNFANSGDRLKLLSIQSWGQLRLKTSLVIGAFSGCANLNLSTVSDALNLSGEITLVGLFSGCTSLTSINNVNDWDVSSITTANGAFANCTNFNSDISNWDVSKITNFTQMFNGCTNFNQDISGWDVSKGTLFTSMFRDCVAFDQNLGSWDVSNATSLANFMIGKTPATFSATNLDGIYNGWSQLTFLNSGLTPNFGTAKYTAAGSAGRLILTSAPNNFIITDGGI